MEALFIVYPAEEIRYGGPMLVHNFSDCQAALCDWLQLRATFSPAQAALRCDLSQASTVVSCTFRGHFLPLLFLSPPATDKKVKGQEVGVGLKCARPTRACFLVSPARPRGAETPHLPAGRALREQETTPASWPKLYGQMLPHHFCAQLITLACRHHRPFGHHHIRFR